MADKDWKRRLGVVYSTNPDFEYTTSKKQEAETLPPSQQKLIVRLERSGRAGKQVTLVEGFVGTEADLKDLALSLKRGCGAGGSVKDSQIIVQGDFRDRVTGILSTAGYKVKRGN